MLTQKYFLYILFWTISTCGEWFQFPSRHRSSAESVQVRFNQQSNHLEISTLDSNTFPCINKLKQNASTVVPKELTQIKNKLKKIDFFISNKIECVKSSLPIKDNFTLPIADSICSQFDNYTIFSFSIKKRSIYKNAFYPSFNLEQFGFVNEGAAKHFFELVLINSAKQDHWVKAPYVYLQSGKFCYKITTNAYLYYYDFMNKVIKQIDTKATRIDHVI